MTDVQWCALMRGDEAYGRNHGYYCFLDAARDLFERGDNQKRLVYKVLTDEATNEELIEELLGSLRRRFCEWRCVPVGAS